jgi:4-amino-4-deoxy-L-arabinose transferase-like glycosyltransferase
MNWSAFDYGVAAVLLAGAALAFLVLTRAGKSRRQRIVVGSLIVLLVALVWLELAVGVFGTPLAGS